MANDLLSRFKDSNGELQYLLEDLNISFSVLAKLSADGELPKDPDITNARFPRRIDADEFTEKMSQIQSSNPNQQIDLKDLRVADMIVTVLHYYNEHVLKDFLNPKQKDIALYRWKEDFSSTFFIRKDHNFLMVSQIQKWDEKEKFDSIVQCGYIDRDIEGCDNWDQIFDYKIYGTGQWKLQYGHRSKISKDALDSSPEAASWSGRKFAQQALMDKVWFKGKDGHIALTGMKSNDGEDKNDLKKVIKHVDNYLGDVFKKGYFPHRPHLTFEDEVYNKIHFWKKDLREWHLVSIPSFLY